MKNFIRMRSHEWHLPCRAAIELQKKLAVQVIRKNQAQQVKTVAGIDVGSKNNLVRAAVAVFEFPGLETLETAVATRLADFPYIPGLLAFREGPVILDALERLTIIPDLLILDGQGIAHPRRFGIACHIGLITALPAIGCAKTRLCGQYQDPGPDRGSRAPLTDGGETIGAVVRTRSRVKPVFVSIGHRIDLQAAVDFTLSCCKRFRLPETTRRAHRFARVSQHRPQRAG